MRIILETAGGAALRRRVLEVFAATMLLASGSMAVSHSSSASAAVSKPGDCRNPQVPRSFHKHVVTAIRISRNLPRSWADSPYLPKIVCWQDTAFDTRFRARAPEHLWHGVFAMTVQEMKTIQGPWLSNDRDELILNSNCFVNGWDACPHSTANTRIVQRRRRRETAARSHRPPSGRPSRTTTALTDPGARTPY